MRKIAIFGDSYISRLQRFTKGKLPLQADVRFFGVGGMRADQVFLDERFKRVFNDLLRFQPDTVYINLGGNDIETSSSPKEVMRHLEAVTDTLGENGIETIYIQEIGKRGKFRGSLSTVNYQQQRLAVNKKLRRKHKQLLVCLDRTIVYPDHFDNDLVHYNRQGMTIYARAIQRILTSKV